VIDVTVTAPTSCTNRLAELRIYLKDTGSSQNSVCEFQLFYYFISLLQAYVLVSFFLFGLIPPKTYISFFKKVTQQQQPYLFT